ncbi:MAG TPA: O-antigen ligase family protein [Rhabdaerophilum sp.]|nr:O-antigen ligase family protein [Rhabdaerophilum sp.]
MRHSGPIPRPAWARYAPFPSGLLIPPHSGEPLLLFVLALMVFTGAFVVFDIAYNVTSLAAIGLFTLLGLRIDRQNMPLILFLIVFNIGGLIALQPHLDFADSREFMIGTCFVATTAVFFCLTMNQNALPRLEAIKWGLILGAVAASLAGIIGWRNIGGLGAYFTMHEGRVSGTFRDPNVLGSFLVLPALYLIHDFLRYERLRLLRLALAAPILLALFLTYSRGSWGAMVIGTMVLVWLMFITAPRDAMRAKITLLALVGFAAAAIGLAALLSVDSIAQVFADRFTLQKDYDSGPSGRFGNQLRALPELLTLPFGYGPNRHWLYFPENPHNTYMMAFSSYGWLGGITFLAFIVSTTVIAWKTLFMKTPFQAHAVVIFAGLVPHLVQNFQIDTDRWRHLFMIYGLCWGLAAISRRFIGEYRAYAHHAYRAQAEQAARMPPRNLQPAE